MWVTMQKRDLGLMHCIEILIIFVFVLSLIHNRRKYRVDYCFALIILLTIAVVFVRFNVGGAGIEVLLEWVTYILLAALAILLDAEHFIERFLRTTYFIALISIVCYIFQILYPDILKSILPQYESNFSYSVWSDAVNYNTFSFNAWGKFLFTFDEAHQYKNVGVFSEPGCYQIVLNSALYCLLFLPSFLSPDLSERRGRYFVVLSIALLTCQSTTGYIGYLAILFAYLLDSKNEANQVRTRIIMMVIVLAGVLILEYSINGSDSILYRAVFQKLFTDTNEFSLTAGTGVYRIYTISTCLISMVRHPFGVGYDEINKMLATLWDSSAAGAVLLGTGAALGVPTILFIICWTLYPIIKCEELSTVAKVLFIFLYFNTELAQSEEIYVTIIVVPLFLYIIRKRLLKDDETDDMGDYIFRQQL